MGRVLRRCQISLFPIASARSPLKTRSSSSSPAVLGDIRTMSSGGGFGDGTTSSSEWLSGAFIAGL